jgi:hypothetical protein
MCLPRWGALKQASLYALIDLGEATTREIARYRWDDPPTASQLRSLRRAARMIARKVRRKANAWTWKLKDGVPE